MTRMNYKQDVFDIRKLDRSPYRNMPSSCKYCGYRHSPSLSGFSCSGCTLKNISNGEESKVN